MKYDKQYLYDMYNATSTEDENGDLETYENWLERQLISRIERLEQLRQPPVSGRVCFSSDCFYHDKTTDTCVGDYANCTVKQTHR